MSKTPAELVKEIGAKKIADSLGMNASTVRMWRNRDRIPRTAWPDLSEKFPVLTQAVLKEIESCGK